MSWTCNADDESIRFYEPPEGKVKKAVRGLGDAVSSVIFHEKDGRDCWVAAGRKVSLIQKLQYLHPYSSGCFLGITLRSHDIEDNLYLRRRHLHEGGR